ncbi:acyl-CoA oxidase [Aurantimicrobium minutum]|uniref:acyl-CoA dehydrogenase family protein n=1 Tax=Aurantimicrobium minutum TaxID=708131 RepID=UPI0024748370|nr:acyl-CoA dehydrogenase [Aurantimicrobium minutum]MDH6277775.1 acyl-CoA oxidase [Aurantimicrobium minutum]
MSVIDKIETENESATVDRTFLERFLLGKWADIRLASRELAGRPEMQGIPGLSRDEHRARALEQLKLLVQNGQVNLSFPVEFGGKADHGGNLAAFQELVVADPSMQIKSGVQWGLFAAAILHLGTKTHHELWLPSAISLETPGVYAMTETGHGSDVSSIATTATFDVDSQDWVINTPFRGAWKDYLGNAAVHGKAAVVFAQLITKGVNHGVHAFYVPLRDHDGNFFPGIGGEDDGLKGGLNGIDNGRLHFDHVRVPRTNLLNRYGDVAEDGTYTSPIASPGRRFFTMLGTLVQGRVSLDGAAVNASKLALQIAVTYGNERRQFGQAGHGETVLMDYQRHQRRLIPLIATTYAQAFSQEVLLEKFDSVFSGADDTDENRQDLETLAAALKPLSTWHALNTLQETREACGGQGFLAENRLTALRADLDIYVTFEGDNNVLLQLVAKRLLTDYSRKFKDADTGTLARLMMEQVTERAVTGSGLRRLGQNVHDRGSTARAVNELRDPEVQHELLTDRVETMIAEIALDLRDAKKSGTEAAVFNEKQSQLIEAASAHGHLLQWEAFTEALTRIEDEGTKQVLTWVRDLFGLHVIEQNLAWYLIKGRLSAQRAEAVTAYVDRLITRLRTHAQDLVDAFGYGPEHLRAEIATGIEGIRQEEARHYFEKLAASGQAPVPEKH